MGLLCCTIQQLDDKKEKKIKRHFLFCLLACLFYCFFMQWHILPGQIELIKLQTPPEQHDLVITTFIAMTILTVPISILISWLGYHIAYKKEGVKLLSLGLILTFLDISVGTILRTFNFEAFPRESLFLALTRLALEAYYFYACYQLLQRNLFKKKLKTQTA